MSPEMLAEALPIVVPHAPFGPPLRLLLSYILATCVFGDLVSASAPLRSAAALALFLAASCALHLALLLLWPSAVTLARPCTAVSSRTVVRMLAHTAGNFGRAGVTIAALALCCGCALGHALPAPPEHSAESATDPDAEVAPPRAPEAAHSADPLAPSAESAPETFAAPHAATHSDARAAPVGRGRRRRSAARAAAPRPPQ